MIIFFFFDEWKFLHWASSSKCWVFYSICKQAAIPKGSYRGRGIEIGWFSFRGHLLISIGLNPKKNKPGHQMLKHHIDSCIFVHLFALPGRIPILFKKGLATGLQSLPRSLPVRNQRGSGDVHRVTLWLLFLCLKTKLPGGASRQSPPVRFGVSRKTNVTARRHPLQASRGAAQRTRRPDARSCPLRK